MYILYESHSAANSGLGNYLHCFNMIQMIKTIWTLKHNLIPRQQWHDGSISICRECFLQVNNISIIFTTTTLPTAIKPATACISLVKPVAPKYRVSLEHFLLLLYFLKKRVTCDCDRTCLGRTAERFCLSSLRPMDSRYQRCCVTAIPQFLFFSFHIQFAISGANPTQTWGVKPLLLFLWHFV